jgi:hypothetical protein
MSNSSRDPSRRRSLIRCIAIENDVNDEGGLKVRASEIKELVRVAHWVSPLRFVLFGSMMPMTQWFEGGSAEQVSLLTTKR